MNELLARHPSGGVEVGLPVGELFPAETVQGACHECGEKGHSRFWTLPGRVPIAKWAYLCPPCFREGNRPLRWSLRDELE